MIDYNNITHHAMIDYNNIVRYVINYKTILPYDWLQKHITPYHDWVENTNNHTVQYLVSI